MIGRKKSRMRRFGMDFMKLVEIRQSCRKYLRKPVPRAAVLQCLEASRLAPSACNSQPWKFVVVDDHALKDRISEKIFSGIYSMNRFARDAGALIAVVSERGKFMSSLGGQIRHTKYYLIDIGIACEHFILQARELGLGTCWIGWFDEKPLKKILGVPGNKKIDAVIALGYPSEEGVRPKVRKTLREIAAFNGYSSEGT